MGAFTITRPVAAHSWIVAAIILILNFKLLADTLFAAQTKLSL